ncbi:MAG TPA: hypothetical protein EYN70_05240, partial [Planctomycetaceae bacterium]|nr:hypothetical protein [Planctomycetaceae bacterium]
MKSLCEMKLINLPVSFRVANLLLVLVAAAETVAAAEPFSATQRHMGTDVTIRLVAADQVMADRAFQAAFARIEVLEKVMSDYDAESEISRLVLQAPMKEPVTISQDLWLVLRRA